MSKDEILKIKELARLFIIFFNAHIESVEVDRSEIQAAYDLIEQFAGKEAIEALKLKDEDYMDFGNYRELPYE